MPRFPTVVLGVSVLAAPLAALIDTGGALAQANPPGQQMAPSQERAAPQQQSGDRAQPPPREAVESDHARGTKVGPSSPPT